jgi:hypothetical protein
MIVCRTLSLQLLRRPGVEDDGETPYLAQIRSYVMGRPLTLEFDEVAADQLRALMERFGERDPELMVARALGLAETIKPFLDEGTLVVGDPKATSDDDYLVRLTFDNAPDRDPKKKAA